MTKVDEEAKTWITRENFDQKAEAFRARHEEFSEEISRLTREFWAVQDEYLKLHRDDCWRHYRYTTHDGLYDTHTDIKNFEKLFSHSTDGKVLVTKVHLDRIDSITPEQVDRHLRALKYDMGQLKSRVEELKNRPKEEKRVELPKIVEPELNEYTPAIIGIMIIATLIAVAIIANI